MWKANSKGEFFLLFPFSSSSSDVMYQQMNLTRSRKLFLLCLFPAFVFGTVLTYEQCFFGLHSQSHWYDSTSIMKRKLVGIKLCYSCIKYVDTFLVSNEVPVKKQSPLRAFDVNHL